MTTKKPPDGGRMHNVSLKESLEKRIRKLEIEMEYLKDCHQTRITMANNGGAAMYAARLTAEQDAEVEGIEGVFPPPSVPCPF